MFLPLLRTSFAERAATGGHPQLHRLLSGTHYPLVTLLIYNAGTSFRLTMEKHSHSGGILLAAGIAFPLFFGMVWIVFDQAVQGTFEITLLKPRSPLLLTMLRGIDIEGFSRMLGGILLVAFTVNRLPAPPLSGWLLFILFVSLSILILFGFALILAASLFVWIGNARVIELMESILVFSRYPGTIFAKPLQWAFAVGIPLSMIALFPAEALLGRFSIQMLPPASSCCRSGLPVLEPHDPCYASGGG